MRVETARASSQKSALPSRPGRHTLLTRAKNLCVSTERRPRSILSGPLRGIQMNLELRTQAQLYLGLYERETFPWIRRLSRGINSGADIGVAEGEFTLFLLTRTGAAQVWAFEPNPAVRPLFEANLQVNGMENTPRLNIVEKFAGDGAGPGEMRLDDMAGELQQPCFIKVDAEGAEGRILRGSSGLDILEDVRWLVETHSQALEIECLQILRERGYHTEVIRQARWRKVLPDYRPLEHNRWLAAWREPVR